MQPFPSCTTGISAMAMRVWRRAPLTSTPSRGRTTSNSASRTWQAARTWAVAVCRFRRLSQQAKAACRVQAQLLHPQDRLGRAAVPSPLEPLVSSSAFCLDPWRWAQEQSSSSPSLGRAIRSISTSQEWKRTSSRTPTSPNRHPPCLSR